MLQVPRGKQAPKDPCQGLLEVQVPCWRLLRDRYHLAFVSIAA